jgi:hypothetical protein
MISINEAKQIREQFGFTHIVILGIDKDCKQHVATHGNNKQSETVLTESEFCRQLHRLRSV